MFELVFLVKVVEMSPHITDARMELAVALVGSAADHDLVSELLAGAQGKMKHREGVVGAAEFQVGYCRAVFALGHDGLWVCPMHDLGWQGTTQSASKSSAAIRAIRVTHQDRIDTPAEVVSKVGFEDVLLVTRQ